jgi:hypothetical protein
MPSAPSYKSLPAVYCPSRGDRRIVRAMLANLRDGVDSDYVTDVVSGSLGHMVCFIAAMRGLTYVIVAQGRSGASYAYCGPDADSAADLAHRILELQQPLARPPLPSPGSLSIGSGGRAGVKRDAVERIVTGLHDRNDSLSVLAWRVEGETAVELSYSHQLPRNVALDWVRWFLSERLHVESPSLPNKTANLTGNLL